MCQKEQVHYFLIVFGRGHFLEHDGGLRVASPTCYTGLRKESLTGLRGLAKVLRLPPPRFRRRFAVDSPMAKLDARKTMIANIDYANSLRT